MAFIKVTKDMGKLEGRKIPLQTCVYLEAEEFTEYFILANRVNGQFMTVKHNP